VTDFVALFTGQGSQFAGMGKELYEGNNAARDTLDRAEAALPGLLALCFEGPEDQLTLTVNTQPCMLAVDVASYVAFGKQPVAAAGHSLGEYAALVAAGALELEDALPLVRARAQAMQEAVPPGVGGMVVLRKMNEAEARQVAAGVTAGVCDLANFNTPGQIVLSGEMAAMDEVVAQLGRKAMKLNVSVPFHSSLLREAGEGFAERLRATDFKDPSFPVYCNVDAKPVTTAAEVRDALERQFAGSVLWQQSIEAMFEHGHRKFVEFGPKPTLSRMATQIAAAHGVEIEARTVATPADLEA
jgi:[acyl-carrier-protein] S-malonyltransferase